MNNKSRNNTIRQKPLLPTLKEKKRYLAYKIISEDYPGKNAGIILLKQIKTIMGVFDSAGAGLQNIYYDPNTNKGIIRVSLPYLSKLRMALLLINNINGVEVMIQPLLISGLLKKTKMLMGE